VRSFQYVGTKQTNAKDPLMDGRIQDAIVKQLEDGGLKQTDADPDIYVTYHMTTKDNTVYDTTTFGYGGFGLGWRGWGAGLGGATTTATTYTEGTLIVDAYEASDKKMVWRGTGTVTIKAKPEKQTQQIQKILTKMGAKWHSILRNEGK
jgi:hypothetical protein